MQKRALIIVIALAIVARLAFLLIFGNSIFFYEKTGLIHGSTAYDEYAQNLLATGVYGRDAGVADSLIPPLYSYVVAAIYATIGRGGLQIGLVQIPFDIITISCIFGIVRRLFKNEIVALLTALFTSLYPYLIFQNLSLNDTAIFMAEMHLFIYLLVRLWEEERFNRSALIWALLAGLVLGISTLTRALLPIFAIFAALWFLFRHGLLQTILRLTPVAILSFILLIPWMIRSYGIYEHFVPVSLNTGENIWQGSNAMTIPIFEAGYDVQWSVPPEEARPLPDYERQGYLMDAGIRFLRENPQLIPRLIWVKFLVYWSIDISPRNNPVDGQQFALDENGDLLILNAPNANLQDIETIEVYSSALFDKVARPVQMLSFGPLLLLAIVGFGLSLRDWRNLSLIWFLQLSMMLLYIIFHPSTRYRLPTDPLLFSFSAYALYCFWERWGRKLLERRTGA